jgi:hypothetical protein
MVHSGASRVRNVEAALFMLRWVRSSFHKKLGGTSYTELLFLHPVGSAGHVVHSSAFGSRSVNALSFMLEWDRYRFHKKCTKIRYTELVFLHHVGSMCHIVHSGVSRL